jgi:chromosome segregation ATPase
METATKDRPIEAYNPEKDQYDFEAGIRAAGAPAPALGYSILANLGDEKQLTVQCFVDSEEPLESIHRKLDRAMAVVDRQKARYKIKDLRKELEQTEDGLARLEEDLNRLEASFEQSQRAFDERIGANLKAMGRVQDDAVARGRAKPVGADAATMTNLKKENEDIVSAKAKAEADRKQARDNIAVSIDRFTNSIAKHKEQIAECEALIAEGG